LKERFERSGRIRSLDTEPLRVRLENGEAPESRLDQLRAIAASRIEAQRKSDEEFMRENAARYEALVQDLKSIKADLTAFAHAQIDPATGQPMDVATLIRRVSATDQHYEKLGREEVIYKDYRTAMLEPGLSPAQRRLLFGAALVGLAQPLPPGEPMPSGNTPGMSL